MDSSHDIKRVNLEGDRLSNLPDDLICRILSYISIEQAIETSALSSRWRYIWTTMPCLNFSTRGFLKLPDFSKFVKHVLSRRNNEIDVSSVTLAFHGKVSQVFVKKILEYAFSHNVQKLEIIRLNGKKTEFPFSLFSSRSLKHLTLSTSSFPDFIMTPPIWELPALTTLILTSVTLFDDNSDKYVGLFSKCANLKNLTLHNCKNDFNICHPGLSSLTLDGARGRNDVNVVTPQLKDLTIRNWGEQKFIVSAPNLSSLHVKRDCASALDLSADFLHLEKVDVCLSCVSNYEKEKVAHTVVSMLQQLHSVKYLTLNFEIIKTLSSSVEVISHLPSPFTNLKSLKIYPVYVTEEQTQSEVTMCTEVKNYLLDGSVGATFTMVSYEEIRAVRNVESAKILMRKLQVVLDQLKENNEKDTTAMDQDKAPMDSHFATVHEQVEVENGTTQPDTKVKCHFGERVTRVESYWEDMHKQMQKGYKKSGCIISMLRKIEKVLTKLPASHRAKLQARFSLLGAEAGTVMDHMMENLKNQHDNKPRFKSLLS